MEPVRHAVWQQFLDLSLLVLKKRKRDINGPRTRQKMLSKIADELIRRINALKLLLRPAAEIKSRNDEAANRTLSVERDRAPPRRQPRSRTSLLP